MTAPRSRKEVKSYKRYMKNKPETKGCVFCDVDKGDEQLVSETKYFKIIRNIFGYSLWDSQRVADHLMIVPKVHTDSLSDLTKQAAIEFVDLLGQYESKRYNVYARAPSSVMKSVTHQHTHLIKPAGKPRKLVFLWRKPYIRFTLG